jgi:hypothetical protein
LPGPLSRYPAAMTWSSMASLHGLSIVPGRYDLVTRCQNNLGTLVLAEWGGAVVFDRPTHFVVAPGSRVPAGVPGTGATSGAPATAGPLAPSPAPADVSPAPTSQSSPPGGDPGVTAPGATGTISTGGQVQAASIPSASASGGSDRTWLVAGLLALAGAAASWWLSRRRAAPE